MLSLINTIFARAKVSYECQISRDLFLLPFPFRVIKLLHLGISLGLYGVSQGFVHLFLVFFMSNFLIYAHFGHNGACMI